MQTCDIHGLFQPDSGAVSAGLNEHDLLGEAAVFSIEPLSSSLFKNLLPITGVWDRSNVKSIVRPLNNYSLAIKIREIVSHNKPGNSFFVNTSISVKPGCGAVEIEVSQ